MENKKYVEGEFALPAPPKGKHTMENIPSSNPTEPIEVEDEEEEHEDSGGLGHMGRRHPINKGEAECAITPSHPQEGDDEYLNAFQGEHMFKRVFGRTRTQGTTPTTMHKSPRLSPQNEATMQRLKLKLNEVVEESKESAPNSPTLPKNTEEH
ncbi:hypothetical protein KI387_004404, partial [Taxus chinensis]